jgi:NitT/TauT family transport system ATP-binding protein
MTLHAPQTDIVSLKKVCQAFPRADGTPLVVLNDVDLTIKPREIVGLLGRSGSGKSSLLRVIAGLARPTAGEVLFKGKSFSGPTAGIAMVFQTFALFPWLSVLDNVEIGLEAQRIGETERRRRALAAIDLIGLDGFESAYPKELSGGMRQRVGFARALVTDPDIMLLDEPFSALDVLTAETLRTDFLELWVDNKIPISSVLIVTHNIEEAVLMCDRVVIFSPNPGRITSEIPIPLAHPRDRQDPAFRQLVEDIYVKMTQRPSTAGHTAKPAAHHIGDLLPDASTNQMAGLMEALGSSNYGGKADLPELASVLLMEVDELFPIVEALQLLDFAEVAEGDIHLKADGKRYVDGDTSERKAIFSEHLLKHSPLVAHIRKVLDERPNHRAPGLRFLTELEDHLSEDDAERVLQSAINWGRYGELFSYDDAAGIFALDDELA